MKMKLNYFTYPQLTKPNGPLSRDVRAQACWYFYTLAQKLKEQVGESTEDQFGLLEGELWMDKRYEGIALAVTTLYGLASPDEFAKAWDEVRECAKQCGLPAPALEYTRLKRGIILH